MKKLPGYYAGIAAAGIVLLVVLGCAIHFGIKASRSDLPEPQPLSASQVFCVLNSAQGSSANPEIEKMCKSLKTRNETSPFDACVEVTIPAPPSSPLADNSTLTDRLSAGTLEMERKTAGVEEYRYPAVFILGNVGSGKTTLSQILSGRLSRLYATRATAGDIVITDYDNLIQHHNVTKRTSAIPNVWINPDSSDVFWDFPGFHENVTAEMDISSAFFLNRVLDQVSEVTFLFTVLHKHVQFDEDISATDFDHMVTNAVKLLRNPSDFNSSIGLVVNKVTGTSSDDAVLKEISKFLEKYTKIMTTEMSGNKSAADKILTAKKLELVRIFLSDDESDAVPKISFVRAPPQCGTLIEMPSVLRSKQMVVDLYSERLISSAVTTEDFVITLKNESLVEIRTTHIPHLIYAIGEQAAKSINNVYHLFRWNFYNKFSEMGFSPEVWGNLKNSSSELGVYIDPFSARGNNSTKVEPVHSAFSSQLVELYHDVGMKLDDENCLIKSIKVLEEPLEFLEMASGHHNPRPDPTWIAPLANFSNGISSLHKFYALAERIDRDLGGYPQQLILSAKLGRNNEAGAIKNSEIMKFLSDNKLMDLSLNETKYWTEKLGEIDNKELATLLRSHVPSEPSMTCLESTVETGRRHLVVSGTNVRFSQFLLDPTQNRAQAKSWPYPCTEHSVKEITVLARNTIFLDVSFHGDCSQHQISMIAPTWNVIGNGRVIRLSCSNMVEYTSDARYGDGYGDRGYDGMAGHSGTSAGSFFGIFSTVLNGANLHINANGQSGGNGQNGGDGRDGEEGKKGKYDDLPTAAAAFFAGEKIGDDIIKGMAEEDGTIVDKGKLYVGVYGHKWYTVRGQPGKKGGDGGRGGNAGLPGYPGRILLLSSSGEASNIKCTMTPGVPGKPGKGGEEGKGGFDGNHHTCRVGTYGLVGYQWSGCYDTGIRTRAGGSGQRGADGVVPSTPSTNLVKTVDPWRIITEYRKQFFDKPPTPTFMRQLDYSPNLVGLLTPTAFARELGHIEERYWKDVEGSTNAEHHKEKYIERYNRFLDRLRSYAQLRFTAAKNAKAVAISPATTMSDPTGEKIALNYIYATALGKIIGMRQSKNTLGVADTEGYFDALSSQLQLLKVKQKETAINEESSKYQFKLNEKVNEAMNFIQGTVQPAISAAEANLEAQTQRLAQELTDYLKEAEENVEKQKKIQKDFANSVPLRYLMSGLKVAGAACSFFGPVGQMVGGAVSAATAVAEPFVLSDNPSKGEPLVDFKAVSGDFTTLMKDQNKKFYEGKIKQINTKINMTKEVAAKKGLKLSDLGDLGKKTEKAEKVVEDFKKAVEGKGTNPISIFNEEINLDKMSDELEEAVEAYGKQPLESGTSDTSTPATPSTDGVVSTSTSPSSNEDELKQKVKNTQERQDKVNKAISVIGKVANVAGAGADFVRTVIDSKKEMGRLDAIVKKAKENVKGVEMKRDQMYKEFLPMLETVTGDLASERKDLSGQSQAGLTVKKWKVKGMLKSMKRNLAKFTDEMKVAEEFQLCVDTLNEAMTLMIDLYDQIEQYEEKKEFADYIANINSAIDPRSKIKDTELKQAIAKVEMSMHANLFAEDYHRAIGAFKQWAFPFAEDYIAAADTVVGNLGNVMNTTAEKQALDEVVDIYKRKVENLSIQMKKYRTTTLVNDEHLLVKHFYGDTVSSHPFYIWTDNKWHGSIQRLLSGKAVRLRADMDADPRTTQMLRGKSAIKYKSVKLFFRARNESEQVDLNEKLKHFRMKMTHSGISVYKVAGQKFVIFDRNQTTQYSFERRQNGVDHLAENVVNLKVSGTRADFLKSPYTWWTFQLIDETVGNGIDHNDLAKDFDGKVDLELVGDGMYLDELGGTQSKLKGLKLADFYQVYRDDDGNKIVEPSSLWDNEYGPLNCPVY